MTGFPFDGLEKTIGKEMSSLRGRLLKAEEDIGKLRKLEERQSGFAQSIEASISRLDKQDRSIHERIDNLATHAADEREEILSRLRELELATDVVREPARCSSGCDSPAVEGWIYCLDCVREEAVQYLDEIEPGKVGSVGKVRARLDRLRAIVKALHREARRSARGDLWAE